MKKPKQTRHPNTQPRDITPDDLRTSRGGGELDLPSPWFVQPIVRNESA